MHSIQNPSLIVELGRLETVLSKPDPEYSYLIQVGNIKFVLDCLLSTKDSCELILIATNLCNFTAGPPFCTQYLQDFKIHQSLLNKLELCKESSDTGILINLISNLIDNFSSFFEFLRSEGFLKLQKICVSQAFSREITASLLFLCLNLSFYAGELGVFDGKILANWIDQVIKAEEDSDIIIDTLSNIVLNKVEFGFSSITIDFLISQLDFGDYKRVIKALKTLGNTSIRGLHKFTTPEFLKILQLVCRRNSFKKCRKTTFWMLKSFLGNSDIAKHLLNTENYEFLADGLSDTDPKTRKGAVGFFSSLFSSAYYKSGDFTLIATIFEHLRQGLLFSESPDLLYNYLKLLKKILNKGKCNKNLLASIEYSSLMDAIDLLFDHPNEQIEEIVSELYATLLID